MVRGLNNSVITMVQIIMVVTKVRSYGLLELAFKCLVIKTCWLFELLVIGLIFTRFRCWKL